jgi:hypothetical protein
VESREKVLRNIPTTTRMGGLFQKLKRPFPKPLKKQRKLPQSTAVSPCQNYEQKVGVIGIDPKKLVKKLELKFPCGFDVHVGRNLERGVVKVG